MPRKALSGFCFCFIEHAHYAKIAASSRPTNGVYGDVM
jgi:hypothetical protein